MSFELRRRTCSGNTANAQSCTDDLVLFCTAASCGGGPAGTYCISGGGAPCANLRIGLRRAHP